MQRKWYKSVLSKDIDAVNGMACETQPGIVIQLLQFRADREKGGQDAFNEHGHAG